jgi:hypothetical protein
LIAAESFDSGMALKRLLGLARTRQAFLRPTYAWLYPELPPGVWIVARDVAHVIHHGVESQQRPWPSPGPRVLADEHFLVRDGETAVGRALRSWRAARRPRRRAGPPGNTRRLD